MNSVEDPVLIVGGGVVGCAVLHALARTGVAAMVVEAEPGLAMAASGTNSGILHTGFDSKPGELETRLILRSGVLREQLIGELGVPILRCGARLRPSAEQERPALETLLANAGANGVEAELCADGSLAVPGESVTDPVLYTRALAAAAQTVGARVMLSTRATGIARAADGAVAVELRAGPHDTPRQITARAVVNCAGLFADELAALAGETPFEIYPRKGEFLVFAVAPGQAPSEILLPVPSAAGKGILVFPTVDGASVAGPTARDRENKFDWTVEADARRLLLDRAVQVCPPLASAQQIGAYAGLRPAGRGSNYVIERSRTIPGVVHVAAIRSTGLSASLAIGEYVAEMLAADERVQLGEIRPLPTPPLAHGAGGPWWKIVAEHRRNPAETSGPQTRMQADDP